jgi:dienelactone hydrolase
MRWAAAIILTTLALAGQAAAQPADLAGTWQGEWRKGGDPLPVTITFAKTGDTYVGVFDSDALQAAGVPVSAITDAGGKVHFEIRGDQTTSVFDGEITDDGLTGGFVDGPDSGGHFALKSVIGAPAPIASREVTFRDGDVTLAGTLLIPAAPGPHPAIVFLQGSGPEGRWAKRYLAQKMAQAGVTALIYDKRGVGGSSGDWRTAGFDDLASDAAAGVRLLQSQPEADPKRVGIYGHSQGGTIAPLVAARVPNLAFIIAAAPGGLDPADVETYSVENSIGVDRLPPAERTEAKAFVQALIDVGYRGKDRQALDAMAERFKTRAWYFVPPAPGDPYWALSKRIAGFKPDAAWRRVKAPVLLFFGAYDERVPPYESLDAIKTALKTAGDQRVMTKVYTDADHSFVIVAPGKTGGWPKHEADYAGLMLNWIGAQVGY